MFSSPDTSEIWQLLIKFFSNASSGLVALISSLIDLLVILAVHGIRNSLLQHHDSKMPILLLSGFLSSMITTIQQYLEN